MTKIMPPNPRAYQDAVDILRAGGLVALPTETVYGLAGLASDKGAVDKIYKAKGRPSHNPLIVHVLETGQAADYADISPLSEALIGAFWPGPLTLVAPRRSGAPELASAAGAGLQTLALRQPDARWREAFLHIGFTGPLVMPSANRSGHVSPTRAEHVLADLGGEIDLIIDGGPCPGGIESTIIKPLGENSAEILRPGVIAAEQLSAFIPGLTYAGKDSAVLAPGMLASHYAPRAKVRLSAQEKQKGEAFLGFGPGQSWADLNLSPTGDLAEAAQNLYAYLRALDKVAVIAIAPIPAKGLGAAINDRLARAGADR